MTGKILFMDPTHEVLAQTLQDAGLECHFHLQTPKDQIAKILPAYVGLVCKSRFRIDGEFIRHGTNLKFIARAGVGVEHIDLEAAAKQQIQVLTSPEGSKIAVGEHTIGLLLGLLNHLMRADREVRNGQWIRSGNTGHELKGKTVGILGYGNMGQSFARCLAGFGCQVLAYDKYKSGFGDAFAREVSLPFLQQESDILSIHIPLMEGNHYFINGAFLDAFHKSIWLVNTARGLVLNTSDLVNRLESGKVLGAALDVLEYEETSFDQFSFDHLPAPFHYLKNSGRVVLTPHIAGWSVESYRGHAEVLARKIMELLRKKD